MIDVEALKNLTIKTEQINNSGNPAIIGLYGFGLTTFVLNLKNAGVYEGNSIIDGMGLFYGGLAQVIAGIMEC